MLNCQCIYTLLRWIVLSFAGSLHVVGIENVIELLDVGEYKVGFEILCDILHEDHIQIPDETFSQLVVVGEYLRVESSYWETLTRKAGQ